MKNNIILLVGKSGSGKSTIANILENDYNCKQVLSYTTRPIREDDKKTPTHIFVDDDTFDGLTDLVGLTTFNGYRYGATASQIEESQVYVIDPAGIDYFKKKYKGSKTPITIYLNVDVNTRIRRMEKRGDSKEQMFQRLTNDIVAFKNADDICDDVVSANDDMSADQIADYIYHVYLE